jgi:hypothetical protein
VKHPVLIQDVARAVAWVHDHAAEHGGDAAQLFLTGHSAGAHLVALLGTDAKRLAEHGKPLSILRGVIPLDSAAMDIREVAASDRRPDSPYRAAFGDEPAGWADASPIVHAANGKGLPPFQMIVAYGPAINPLRLLPAPVSSKSVIPWADAETRPPAETQGYSWWKRLRRRVYLKARAHLLDAGLQLFGMYGLFHTYRRTLGWVWRLFGAEIQRHTEVPASRIPMRSAEGGPASHAVPGTVMSTPVPHAAEASDGGGLRKAA